jgi:uncharacterized protein YkwD
MLIPAITAISFAAVTHQHSKTASCLHLHNSARSSAGLPGFLWDSGLASAAQSYADHLHRLGILRHSGTRGHGENLYTGPGSYNAAVSSWMAEKTKYHGKPIGQSLASYGHFTQLMWPTTRTVGCGERGKTVVCRYFPAGNVVGHSLTRF